MQGGLFHNFPYKTKERSSKDNWILIESHQVQIKHITGEEPEGQSHTQTDFATGYHLFS
jgi:hypothetical protein